MPPETFHFDLITALYWGLPAVAVLAALSAWTLAGRGVAPQRRAILVTLRGLALLTIVFLLARPVAVQKTDPDDRTNVVVLLDQSKSMSLVESGTTRYEKALALVENQVIPELKARGLANDVYLFAEQAAPAAFNTRREAAVMGRRTDLGGAIVHALKSAPKPPLAMIAVTDGVANISTHNRDALLGLVDRGIPFVGVGVGDDEGVMSLSLERLTAPSEVPPEETFKLTSHLQAIGAGEIPAFDLILLRRPLNGGPSTEEEVSSIVQVRRVAPSQGSRIWTESFEVVEDEEGLYEYTVEVQSAVTDQLVTVATRASTPVTVTSSEEFRVLFAQGALTWNFKFIGRALRNDPTITLTGFSRTSERSVFRQNVESSGELLDGFPDDLNELSPYRVVILSDLSPVDLSPAQQEAVARFVGELGGGLLIIGGTGTFDPSWRTSRLEELLPVTFDNDTDVNLERSFHLELTEEALRHPVFQLDNGQKNLNVWQSLPTFQQYGRVLDKKPGAVVWAQHSHDEGPNGRRILMASQYYGAGLSAIISVQSLWRWRLAKELDPTHFDRFFQQLLRFLGQSGSREVSVQFADQEQGPGLEVTALIERRPRPDGTGMDEAKTYNVRVEDPQHGELLIREITLRPLRPAEIRFRTEEEGVYAVKVTNEDGVQMAARPLEIREIDREMERTSRDLENLRQWAGLSRGLAIPLEECGDVKELLNDALTRAAALQRSRTARRPLGMNGWVLAWLLACLGGEWALRKVWGLT